MSPSRPISEDDLQGLVDEVLDPARRAEVEAYLAQHPDVARRVATYSDQRAALRAAFAPIADAPIPPELNLRALAEARKARALAWRPALAAAFVLCVGGALGWTARDLAAPPVNGVGALAREATDNYRVYAADALRPIEMGPAEKTALVSWVSDRLGSPVKAPDLASAGYRFLGGRLVATPHGPAAMFFYDDAGGQRLAVLVRPMRLEKNTRMSERADGGLGGVSWADSGMGYSLVGPAGFDTLHPLADEVRRQLKQPV
jgi:anti-sigma factor RsiW